MSCGQGDRLRTHTSSQGLRRSTPRAAKSLTFRVTRVRRCSSAVAAIIPSGALKGRPANSRIPPSQPHRAAMACVTGRTRPGNRSLKWRSSEASKRARRAASCMVVNPVSSSPILTTLRNNAPKS